MCTGKAGERRGVNAYSVVLVLGCALCAGRNAPGSVPITQTVADGAFDPAFRIIGSRIAGTGTLIDMRQVGDNLRMCFVTADHVLRNNGPVSLGFRSQNAAAGTSGGGAFTSTPSSFKTDLGGPDAQNPADIGFLGVTVDTKALTPPQADLLRAVVPMQMALAPAAAPFDFTANGYGSSGTRDLLGYPLYAYIYHAAQPAEQYGNERTFSNTIANYLTLKYAGDAGTNVNYNYDGENWFLRSFLGGAIAGEGTALPGDSGSAVVVGGKIEGIVTRQLLDTFNDGTKSVGIKYGYEGDAARMTQAYLNWFTNDCQAYMAVPEPGAAVQFLAAYVALWLMARRRARTLKR